MTRSVPVDNMLQMVEIVNRNTSVLHNAQDDIFRALANKATKKNVAILAVVTGVIFVKQMKANSKISKLQKEVKELKSIIDFLDDEETERDPDME